MMKEYEISPRYWLSRAKVLVPPPFLLLQEFQLFLSSQHVWQIRCSRTDFWPKYTSKIYMIALGVFQPKHQQLLWQLLCWLLHHEIYFFLKKIWIILSSPPRSNGLSLFFALMTLLGDHFWDLAFLAVVGAVF